MFPHRALGEVATRIFGVGETGFKREDMSIAAHPVKAAE